MIFDFNHMKYNSIQLNHLVTITIFAKKLNQSSINSKQKHRHLADKKRTNKFINRSKYVYRSISFKVYFESHLI